MLLGHAGIPLMLLSLMDLKHEEFDLLILLNFDLKSTF